MSEVDLNSVEYCDPFDEEQYYWMRVEHLGRYLYAKNNIKDGCNILDIACANGYGTKLLSEKCNNIIGIDRNKEYIDLAMKANNASNIKYKLLDIDNEDINYIYDYIVCFETLEHVKSPKLLLKKLYNCLQDNGILFLSVPNAKYEIIENGVNKDIYHLHTFEYNSLVKLIKDTGFIIEEVLGQAKTNMIVNNKIDGIEEKGILIDAIDIGYPNKFNLNETYSYLFILKKK